MKKALSVLLIAAALFGFYGGAVNINDVLACKDYWEEKGEQTTADMNKLEDGLNQLKENEQAYLDGKDQLAEGEEALAEGEKAYAEGKAQLAEGEADYAAAPAKLADAKQKIAKGEKDLAAGEKKLADGYKQYEKGKKDYAAAPAKLAAAKEQIEQGEKDLAAGEKALEAGKKQYEAGKQSYKEAPAKLAAAKKQIEQGEKDLAAGEKALEAGKKQYEAGKQSYKEAPAKLAAAKKQIEQGEKDLAAGEKALEEGKKQYEEGKKSYKAAPAQIKAGKEAISGLDQLIDGLNAVKTGYLTQWQPGFEDKLSESELAAYMAGESNKKPGLRQARDVIAGTLKAKEEDLGLIEQISGTENLTAGILKAYGSGSYEKFDNAVTDTDELFGAMDKAAEILTGFSQMASNMAGREDLQQLKAGLSSDAAKDMDLNTMTATYKQLDEQNLDTQLSETEQTLANLKKMKEAGSPVVIDAEGNPVLDEDGNTMPIDTAIAKAEAGIKTLKGYISSRDNLAQLIGGRSQVADEISKFVNQAGDKLALVEKLSPELAKAISDSIAVLQPNKGDTKNSDYAAAIGGLTTALKTLSAALDGKVEEIKTNKETLKSTFTAWDSGYKQLKGGESQLADPKSKLPYAFKNMLENETIRKTLKSKAKALIPVLEKYQGDRLVGLDVDKFDEEMNDLTANGGPIDQCVALLKAIRTEAKKQVAAGEKAYKEAPAKLAAAKAQIDQGEKDLEDGKAKLDEGKKQYAQGQKDYEEAPAKLAAAKAQIDQGEKDLDAGKAKLDEGKKQYAQGQKDYKEAPAKLAAAKKQIDQGEKDLEAGKAKLADGKKQYAQGQKDYEAAPAKLADAKKQLAQGEKDLAAGKAKLADGKKQYAQGLADFAAAPAKLADGRAKLADAEKQLADGRQALADGKAKLAEYEDGEQQVRDGLATLMSTKPDGGLTSILDRRNGDDDFDNGDDHLDLDEGLEAVEIGRGYQADSGVLITKEITNRAIGTAAGLGAGALAVLAAILSFLKKNKGAGVCALLAAAAGAAGVAVGTSAGMEFSHIAGSAVTSMPWIAAGGLAAVALVHAIVHFAGGKAA